MTDYMDRLDNCPNCGKERWTGNRHECQHDKAPAKSFTFDQFQLANDQRCKAGFGHELSGWSLLEWCGAMAGEVGEACNKAKKLKRIDGKLKGNKSGGSYPILTEAMAHEIGDAMVYGFLTLSAAGYNAGDVIRHVFNSKSDEIGSDIKI